LPLRDILQLILPGLGESGQRCSNLIDQLDKHQHESDRRRMREAGKRVWVTYLDEGLVEICALEIDILELELVLESRGHVGCGGELPRDEPRPM
jgi:hypothetical protein